MKIIERLEKCPYDISDYILELEGLLTGKVILLSEVAEILDDINLHVEMMSEYNDDLWNYF